MINRQMKSVELWRVTDNTDKSFGNDEEHTKIAIIDMAIHEKNIARYNSNGSDIVVYDMIGLTDYSGDIEKDMYIIYEKQRYNIQYVCNSKRFKQVLLKRAE